jgi:hypothetical protein
MSDDEKEMPCSEPGCTQKVVYKKVDPVSGSFFGRPQAQKSEGDEVYLTCPNGHTRKYPV